MQLLGILYHYPLYYLPGVSGSEDENEDDGVKEDKSQGNVQEVEPSNDRDDESDSDSDDDEEEEEDDNEVTAGATLTVGDLIQAMKTKKKIPVSQPSSVVSGVCFFFVIVFNSGKCMYIRQCELLGAWTLLVSWWIDV